MSHKLINIHLAMPQQVEQALESSMDQFQFPILVQSAPVLHISPEEMAELAHLNILSRSTQTPYNILH